MAGSIISSLAHGSPPLMRAALFVLHLYVHSSSHHSIGQMEGVSQFYLVGHIDHNYQESVSFHLFRSHQTEEFLVEPKKKIAIQ